MKSIRILCLGLAAAVGVLSLGAASRAGMAPVSAEADASKPFVVKIHADWCGTCKRLDPVIQALETEKGDELRVVVLDVTDEAATSRSMAEAQRLGIEDFFRAYRSRTGNVGVLRGDTRETVSVLEGETDLAVYADALDEARG